MRDLDAIEYPDLEVEHELVETRKLLSFLHSSERELVVHLIDVISQRDESDAKADIAIGIAARASHEKERREIEAVVATDQALRLFEENIDLKTRLADVCIELDAYKIEADVTAKVAAQAVCETGALQSRAEDLIDEKAETELELAVSIEIAARALNRQEEVEFEVRMLQDHNSKGEQVITTLKQSLQRMSSRVDSVVAEECTSLRTSKTTLLQEKQTAEAKLAELENKVNVFQREKAGISSELLKAKSDKCTLDIQNDFLSEHIRVLEQTKQNLEADNECLKDDNCMLQAERACLQNRISEFEIGVAVDIAEDKSLKNEEENQAQEGDLFPDNTAPSEQEAKLEAKCCALRSQVSNLHAENEDLKDSLLQSNSAVSANVAEKNKLKCLLQETEQRCLTLKKDLRESNDEIDELQSKNDELVANASEATAKASDMSSMVDQINQRYLTAKNDFKIRLDNQSAIIEQQNILIEASVASENKKLKHDNEILVKLGHFKASERYAPLLPEDLSSKYEDVSSVSGIPKTSELDHIKDEGYFSGGSSEVVASETDIDSQEDDTSNPDWEDVAEENETAHQLTGQLPPSSRIPRFMASTQASGSRSRPSKPSPAPSGPMAFADFQKLVLHKTKTRKLVYDVVEYVFQSSSAKKPDIHVVHSSPLHL